MNGVASGTDGSFRLQLTAASDNVTLIISSVGYFSQERRVEAADTTISVELVVDDRPFVDCVMVPARYEIGLSSGLLHTPIGAQLGWRPRHVPAKLSASYQTDLQHNRQLVAEARSDDWHHGYWLNAGANLEHRHLRLGQPGLRFSSTALTSRLSFPRYGYFTLLLGGGYAQRRTETRHQRGYGYQFGAQKYLNGPGLGLSATATRWPRYWQVQASASRSFWRVMVSLQYQQIRDYHELNLGATYSIY